MSATPAATTGSDNWTKVRESIGSDGRPTPAAKPQDIETPGPIPVVDGEVVDAAGYAFPKPAPWNASWSTDAEGLCGMIYRAPETRPDDDAPCYSRTEVCVKPTMLVSVHGRLRE